MIEEVIIDEVEKLSDAAGVVLHELDKIEKFLRDLNKLKVSKSGWK